MTRRHRQKGHRLGQAPPSEPNFSPFDAVMERANDRAGRAPRGARRRNAAEIRGAGNCHSQPAGLWLRGSGAPVRLPPRSLADEVKGSLRSALTGRPLTPPALFENGATERRRQATNRGPRSTAARSSRERRGTDAEAWPKLARLLIPGPTVRFSRARLTQARRDRHAVVAHPEPRQTEANCSKPRARTRAGGPIRGPNAIKTLNAIGRNCRAKPNKPRTRAHPRTWAPGVWTV